MGSNIAYRSVGADAHIGPSGTDEFAADFCENGVHCAGRCRHRPLQTFAIECKNCAPPAHTQMRSELHGSVFCHLPARQLLSMGALSPRRRRCSSALQRDSRVLAAMFFYGLILWHRGTIRFASSVSFCILFLTSQKKYARGATVTVSLLKTAVPVPTGQAGRCGHRPLQSATQNRLRSNSCGVGAKG